MDSKEIDMKRWNKTTIVWSFTLGLETNVPVTDWHDPKEKHVHKIHGVKATAMFDRTGEIEIDIRRVAISPTTERKRITDILSVKLPGIFSYRAQGKENSEIFTICFKLDNGDEFCDTAIKLVSAIFEALGVEDSKGLRLAYFTVTQKTFFWFDNSWISFARWLRMSHLLPVFGPEDI